VKLKAGQVFEVRESVAIYLFAMHCAQRVTDARTDTPEPPALSISRHIDPSGW
jgi:hypothetical protein